jgi:hypothetical protein
MAKTRTPETKTPARTIAGTPANHSFQVGENYLIRAVTMYYTGRLAAITETDLLLEDAAWIADTGRFHNALKTGVLHEIEPFVDPVIVPRGAIVDATPWKHALPREQK